MANSQNNSVSYRGHGKSGGIQVHSMGDLYSQFGLIMVRQGDQWQAEKNGKVVASSPYYSYCELLAVYNSLNEVSNG